MLSCGSDSSFNVLPYLKSIWVSLMEVVIHISLVQTDLALGPFWWKLQLIQCSARLIVFLVPPGGSYISHEFQKAYIRSRCSMVEVAANTMYCNANSIFGAAWWKLDVN